MGRILKRILIIMSSIYIIFYLVVDDLIVSDFFDTLINIIIHLSNADFFIATILLLIGIVIDMPNDEKTNDNRVIKKYKVLKFIGILPFIFVLLNGIFSMFFGFSFFFNGTYGPNAFILTIAFTSLLIWPLYIIGIILIILSSIKLKKLQNKL